MWRATLAGSLIIAATIAAQPQRSRAAGDWISYGGTNWSQKYSPLDQINTRTPPNGGGKKIRAYDKATGQVLWETALEAGSTGTLMTYLHKGKQYVVVAIGGVQHPAEFVAFSLP